MAMIVSRPVLAAMADRWDEKGLFESRWSNLVANWCILHYRKYHKAPGKEIESIFDKWSTGREGKDKETVKLIEKFLIGISSQYVREKKRTQVQFIIDLAGEHFNAVKGNGVCDSAKALMEDGETTKALALLEGFKKVEMGLGSRISVLTDKSIIRDAFEEKSDPLIKYGGALGEFFGDALERDGFISFEGPEKRGKTGILIEMAWRAMEQGRKVAMFQVGDLSQAQIMRRFMVRASGRPLKATKKGKPILIPFGLGPPQGGGEGAIASVSHKSVKFKEDLAWQDAWKACKKITSPWENDPLLMLDVYPNTSISINGVASAVSRWSRNGWHPDVVIIDYADILAPIDGKVDTRHQIDSTWRGMRALSQREHCLVLTATQTNAASYDTETISMKHFSENKSKRAHVTGSVGINQTEDEKKLGIYRFSWIVGREWDYSNSTCVHTAGSMALASPFMFSTF